MVAILMVVLIGFRFVPTKRRPTKAILTTGTELTLLAVTQGTNNQFFPGGLWERLRYRFVPAKGLSFGRFRITPVQPMSSIVYRADGSLASPDNAVYLWVGHRGPTNAPKLPFVIDQGLAQFRATLADEKGEEWEMTSDLARGARSSTSRGLNEVFCCGFSFYPRRGQTLRLRIYAYHDSEWLDTEWLDPTLFRRSGVWGTLAEFTLPNPTPGPYPVWKPSNLPVTRTNGDLVVSLVGLVAGTDPDRKWPGGRRPFTRVTLEIKENGRLTETWLPDRIEASDATGNQPAVPIFNYPSPQLLAAYSTHDMSLNPSEVWKLQLRLLKEKDSTPERVWTSPELALGTGVSTSQTTNWQTGRLTFETRIYPPSGPDIRSRLDILAKLNPLPKNTRLRLVEIVDNQGRKWDLNYGYLNDSGFQVMSSHSVVPSWAKITIRLVETRTFEYVVQPTRQ
jgi:hypothetical protein